MDMDDDFPMPDRRPDEVPQFFVEWLRGLSDDDAAQMREFLDNMEGHGDIIEILSASHPAVATMTRIKLIAWGIDE